MSGYRFFAICMQWVRRKDTLRPEEKQFGPWLRATLGKVQKPQTIIAMTNGEFSRGEGDHEVPLERRGKGDIPRWVVSQSGKVLSGLTRGVGITRTDMVKGYDSPSIAHPEIPVSLQSPNFE